MVGFVVTDNIVNVVVDVVVGVIVCDVIVGVVIFDVVVGVVITDIVIGVIVTVIIVVIDGVVNFVVVGVVFEVRVVFVVVVNQLLLPLGALKNPPQTTSCLTRVKAAAREPASNHGEPAAVGGRGAETPARNSSHDFSQRSLLTRLVELKGRQIDDS